MRLLLLEDDPTLGSGLHDYLSADGHHVDWCRSLAEVRLREAEPYDVWLVDWNLPDGSGLQWLRGRRDRGLDTTAVVLTARDQLADRIDGLDSGADDYLVKPFAVEELVARLRAIDRRRTGGLGRRSYGRVEIDFNARAVWADGQPVELTAREWTLLQTLARRAGRIVSAPELEQLVLGGDHELASNALQVHVSHLRSKLGRDLIETVRGLGYRLRSGTA
jgi:two-component system OmpR family response regulator